MKSIDPELEKREFWAAHYYLLIADEGRESSDLVEPIFGLADGALKAYYFGDLVRPDHEARPLWLPLRDGYSAGVEYADCGDDGHEVRFFISHEAWDEPEMLGLDSAHFAVAVPKRLDGRLRDLAFSGTAAGISRATSRSRRSWASL